MLASIIFFIWILVALAAWAFLFACSKLNDDERDEP